MKNVSYIRDVLKTLIMYTLIKYTKTLLVVRMTQGLTGNLPRASVVLSLDGSGLKMLNLLS